MSGQLRTLKKRIRSIESTKKITRAMEMVATAKLRRFQTLMSKGRVYLHELENLLKRIDPRDSSDFPALMKQREEKRIALLLITSDTGLCGTYNNDLIAEAKKFLQDKPQNSLLIGVGKKGVGLFNRMGYPCYQTFTDIKISQTENAIHSLRETVISLFEEKTVDAVYVTKSHLLTAGTSQINTEKLLPFAVKEKEEPLRVPYIMEPSPRFLFSKLIPTVFSVKIRMILLESFVAEQIARMQAMHQATENARDLVDSLTLLRNKARQAAITKEMIEIISGSQALKK